MDCRVALVQSNPRLGDLHANLNEHVERVEALAGAADLIVFPELSLTGYFLKDQVFELGLERGSTELARLAELSERASLLVGFVERSPEGRLFNAAGFFEDGELLGVHRKVHLVSYGLFDESRDFAPGEEFTTIQSKHGRFGPLICEDVWHVPSAYTHFLNHADAMVVLSASPARGVEAAARRPGPGQPAHLEHPPDRDGAVLSQLRPVRLARRLGGRHRLRRRLLRPRPRRRRGGGVGGPGAR